MSLEPSPDQVYRIKGRPALYVRTEQRPGSRAPEHLFVVAHDRAVFTRWADKVPREAELIVDWAGRQQANEYKWLLWAAEHKVGILFDLLTQACAWLPKARADELRRRWHASQPDPEGEE